MNFCLSSWPALLVHVPFFCSLGYSGSCCQKYSDIGYTESFIPEEVGSFLITDVS